MSVGDNGDCAPAEAIDEGGGVLNMVGCPISAEYRELNAGSGILVTPYMGGICDVGTWPIPCNTAFGAIPAFPIPGWFICCIIC